MPLFEVLGYNYFNWSKQVAKSWICGMSLRKTLLVCSHTFLMALEPGQSMFHAIKQAFTECCWCREPYTVGSGAFCLPDVTVPCGSCHLMGGGSRSARF